MYNLPSSCPPPQTHIYTQRLDIHKSENVLSDRISHLCCINAFSDAACAWDCITIISLVSCEKKHEITEQTRVTHNIA